MAGSCKCGYELSGSIIFCQVPDQLRTYQRLQKDSIKKSILSMIPSHILGLRIIIIKILLVVVSLLLIPSVRSHRNGLR
jgi:hypothetical protein